jgi:hypothetical protein
MTLRVTFNPPDFADDYVRCLNECFGHWGDASRYHWAFRRTAGSHESDLMIVHGETGDLLAGSAVSYRRVEGAGRQFDVGIMTGSWTLPPARGQGCFTRIIEESRVQAGERGCELLLAFVTWDNASRRRLEEAGSRMIPSRYMFTPDDAEKRQSDIERPQSVDLSHEALWQLFGESRGDAFHFAYPSVDDFVGQILDLTDPVEQRRVGEAIALVEVTATTDRVASLALRGESPSAVYAALEADAHARGRRFFAFAMGESEVEALDTKEGFLTVLPTPRCQLAVDELTTWHIDSGDRM